MEKDLHVISALANNDAKKLKRYLHRRLFGEPIEYIQKSVDFFGRKFFIDRRAYIPNPETEKLVETFLKHTPKKFSVVDVGTGSGVIAITIKKERPESAVYGIDIDPGALEVAKQNKRSHEADIKLVESYYVDSLNVVEPEYIIADLPYGNENYLLPTNDSQKIKQNPSLSVFHPEGSLDAYAELFESIKRKKWSPKLFIETGVIDRVSVEKIIPPSASWDYIEFKNYSVTIIDL